MKSFAACVNKKQHIIPARVGIINASSVQRMLPVSFFMVSKVVEQGQCINENSIVFTAVTQVQPFSTKSCFNSCRLFISVIVPPDKYDIIINGITISFAGNPRTNANNIVPSSPIIFANGSSTPEQIDNRVRPSIDTLANSHMISPAGAATLTALPRTKSVLSRTERTITAQIFGRR